MGLQTPPDDLEGGNHRDGEEHASDARDLATRQHPHDHQRGMDVERGDPTTRHALHPALVVVGARVKRKRRLRRGARQVVLGQAWPVVGRLRVPIDQGVMAPSNPSARNSCAALFPAAPAPTIATDCGAAIPRSARRRTSPVVVRAPVTTTRPPCWTTS